MLACSSRKIFSILAFKKSRSSSHTPTAVISRTKSLPTLINIIPTSTMPSKPEDNDTKKTTEKTGEKKEEYHNFLVVDHTLRPDGFHLSGGEQEASK
jgi:hypothetical protein